MLGCWEICLLPEQLSDYQDELWSVELVEHVERIKTIQSTLVCVCVCEGRTHKLSREYQMSQFEHGAFSTACLGAQNPLGGPPTLLYNGHCGGVEKRPGREANQCQNL